MIGEAIETRCETMMTTKARALAAIEGVLMESYQNLKLNKNASGSYTHEDAQIFRDEVKTILARQYFHAEDGTNGMEGLLANSRTAANGTAARPQQDNCGPDGAEAVA